MNNLQRRIIIQTKKNATVCIDLLQLSIQTLPPPAPAVLLSVPPFQGLPHFDIAMNAPCRRASQVVDEQPCEILPPFKSTQSSDIFENQPTFNHYYVLTAVSNITKNKKKCFGRFGYYSTDRVHAGAA